ncbi:MAG: SDR family oxidoreductase [Deltaproteobacteria bacterium]|nr:SDR family oxidoreductase [Deltaproteobacteria bacterium]
MDLLLKDRVVLVTGGASGIGKATAALLTKEGSRVVVIDREASAAEAAARETGGDATGVGLDVTRFDDVRAAIGDIHGRFGRIDGLVNAAGVLAGGRFVETEPASWKREIDVCLYGVLNCCHATLPIMASQNGGQIVNIASDAAKVGEGQMASYAAAKGAVVAFSKSIAKEHGRNAINVNVVCPGTTKTAMTAFLTPEMEAKWIRSYPLRRLGEPLDIANMIVFLLSGRASWITGQAISVNGGYSMC